MAQHDYDIANGSGSAVRADINAVLDAIVSQNSGATTPSTTFPYMFWADTTAGILKMRNAANTTWIDFQNLDGTLLAGSVGDTILRDSAALSVIGRSANSSGDPGDIAAANDGEVLRRSGTTLGFGTIATAGIAANAVTDAKFRQSAGLSVVGRSANTTGDVADIVGTDGQVLRVSGTTLGFGTIATAGIAANAVTNAKLAQVATNSILGRVTASTGDVETLTATQVKTILALVKADVGLGNVDNTSDATKNAAAVTLTNKTIDASANTVSNITVAMMAAAAVVTAAETIVANDNDTTFPTSAAVKAYVDVSVAAGVADGDKGDITVASSGTVWTVDVNAISNAKFRQSAGLSVVGRSANTTGDVADITAANDGEVLRRSGTTLGFGTIATAGHADDSITNAKLANMAQNTIKGRVTASTGDPEDLTATQVKTILALVKADVGLGNVDNTSDATKFTSPALTGTPTAPTASAGTNTTQVATTAFVDDAARRGRGINPQTVTSYTFVLTDAGKDVFGNNASAQTYTVPPNSTAAFTAGDFINVFQKGAGQITIAAGAGVTIRSSGGKLKLTGQYSGATLKYEGSDVWYLVGDISA